MPDVSEWRRPGSLTPESFRPRLEDAEIVEATARRIGNGEIDPVAEIPTLPYVKIAPNESDLPNSRLRFLSAFWHSLLRSGSLPDASHIDPSELRPAVGNLVVLEPIGDGTDFLYRLYGTYVAEAAGRDWTGWSVAAMCAKTGSPYSHFYRGAYRASVRMRTAIYTEHCSPDYLGTVAWRRLILPFQDKDGEVRRLLVGNIPTGKRTLLTEQLARQAQALE